MEAILTTRMAQKETPNIKGTEAEYRSRLFGFIRGKVKTNEDAEDLLQDVWYRFSQITNLDQIESISGWLFSVARNRVTDFYRKKKTENIEDYSFETEDGDINFKEILLADDNNNPELKQFKNLFWDQLLEALDELPENQRDVFVMNELEDLTLQEIADKTGQNLKTIISRKGYAIKYLRLKLENLYNEFINT
jgi:RNA polymerase sigma factor (sigma-70 family)